MLQVQFAQYCRTRFWNTLAYGLFCSAVVFGLWSGVYTPTLSAQQVGAQGFYMDVLFFKGVSDSTQQVDVYVVVPYTSISFIKKEDVFAAGYTIKITVQDKNYQTVQTITKERFVKEESADATVGATGGFDYSQTVLAVAPGQYTVNVEVIDAASKRSNSLQRSFTALDLQQYSLAMSSVMFASSIAQNNGRYAITPYLADEISPLLAENFFLFFETYNATNLDSADFVYEVLDEKKTVIFRSKRVRKGIKGDRVQQYIRVIPGQQPLTLGSYSLRLSIFPPDTNANTVIMASSRAMRVEWRGAGGQQMLQGEELSRAVRQMRYVATQQEISFIQAASGEQEKQKRFYEYWRQQDPTPTTTRNEAFDEYYGRIDYANRNFRNLSFQSEGWMSDMGMVYVVYGQPQYIREPRREINGRILWTWIYTSFGREFVFSDFSGFGNDFRLSSGVPFERYRYRR